MVFENEVNLYGDAPISRKFSSQDTRFNVVQGEIDALITEAELIELEDSGKTMYSAMNDIKVDVNGIHGTISSLTTTVDGQSQQITSINSKQAQYEASLDEFSASLSDTQSDLETTNQNLSSLQLDTNQFKTTVANTYSTKTQAQGYASTAQANAIDTASSDATAKANAAESNANNATDNKLKNYSTTQSVQSMIDQKADQITLSVSNTYATKNEAEAAARSTITGDTLYYLATASGSNVTTSTSGWTTTPQTMTSTKKYLWTYHKYTYGDNHTSNTTPVITGTYGEKGDQGSQGTSVTVSKTEYQSGTSATTAPTGTWSTSIPTVAEGNYLWTRVTYSDGKTAYSVAKQGKSGVNGSSVTVKSTAYAYQLSTSGTTVPTGTWSSSPVAPTETQYAWTRTTTTFSDNSQAITYTVGGKSGSSATAYSLIVSHAAVAKTKNGAYSPSSITLTAKAQVGTSALSNYSGRFKIETTADNSSWNSRYTSSANENSYTYTIPSDIVAIRCSLYLAGGTSTLLDQQTIPIVTDGTDGTNGTNGKDGADAYTVILANENHTFVGEDTHAIPSQTACSVIAYKGAKQVATKIGTIGGIPTGMTVEIVNNNTTTARLQISVGIRMTKLNGTLTVPVGVDGNNFLMSFTYSIALNGIDGVGIKTVTPLYYAKNSRTAPSAPTSKITSTTVNVNVWTKAIPALTDTYKYLYTCDQVEYDDGSTIKWTTVVEDMSSADIYTRVRTAEQKVTDSAIISTVTQSGQFPTKGEIILAINENDQSEATINANKIDLRAYSTVEQLSQVAAEKSGSFYGGEEPTNSNYPASDWNTSDIRQTHLGDLYYNKSNGFVYQYTGTSNGLLIKFNEQSKTESERYDYVIIYYQSGGKTYASEKLGGSSIGGKEIFVPTKDFWVYWHTDGSVNNYYGFSIDSVSVVADRETPSFSSASIPSFTVTDTSSYSDIASPHSPYVDNANQLWHYTYSGSITITTSYSWKRRKDKDIIAAESSISALGDQIALKVSKGDVIAEINLSSEEAKINAAKINLEGYLTVTNASNTYASKTSASANEQYVYYQTDSTTASAPSSWVTSTSDASKTWTTRRPTFRQNYPNIFIAKQSKSVSGSVTCTAPIIDKTTTVIDGGSIITHSLSASQVYGGTFTGSNYECTDTSKKYKLTLENGQWGAFVNFFGKGKGTTFQRIGGIQANWSGESNSYKGIVINANGSGKLRAIDLMVSNYDVTLDSEGDFYVNADLTVTGKKDRLVSTEDYGKRHLHCYEMPSAMFGDVGEGVINEDGYCYIAIDSIFAETVSLDDYQVFLQKYGLGDCAVIKRNSSYFVVQGTPNLKFAWEIKAKQKDFDQRRLEARLDNKIFYEDYSELATIHLNNLLEERNLA